MTNEFNAAPQILVSDLAQQTTDSLAAGGARRHGVSNRDGLGATVRVSAGGRTLVRYNDGKSGYLSQSALPLYFGLGGASEIERVEVLWPSGRRSLVEKTQADTTLRIQEPPQ